MILIWIIAGILFWAGVLIWGLTSNSIVSGSLVLAAIILMLLTIRK